MKMSKFIITTFLSLWVSTLFAHDVLIKQNSNLRADSNSQSRLIKLLKPKTEVKLLTKDKENGYYQVLHELGIGYVWARNVTVIQEYNRDHYKHWVDEDKDCQKTRDEALIAESEIPVTFKENKTCKVATGRWTDPYSGEVYTDPKALDVDHMVPLKNAHQSGGYQWTYQKRKAYANDLTNAQHLIAVDKSLNRSKGAKGPDEWLPPLESYHCQYVKDWEGIKQHWGLTMTESERAVIDSVKQGLCP